jgi:cytochrome P450
MSEGASAGDSMRKPASAAADPASAGPVRRPPGPPHRRRGLIGSAGYYARFLIDPIGFVRSRFDAHGDIYYAPSDGGGLYVLRHPDHLREVLITRASSFSKEHSSFRQLARFLGGGLLTSDGAEWRRHRRMVQPAFQQARLAGYAPIMSEEAAATVARVLAGSRGEARGGRTIDLGREMTDLTLRVVSRSLFGHDAAADLGAVSAAMATFQRAALRPDLLPSWVPLPGGSSVDRAVASLDRIILGMVERRRRHGAGAAGAAAGAAGPAGAAGAAGAGGPGEARDLLGMLLSAEDEGEAGATGGSGGGAMTAREVRDELVTLFLAGHETTSQALTWAIYLLATHPGVAQQLYREIDGALGGRAATIDDLPSLPYTGQVIDEAMRLYPPVYTVGRRASEDTEIGGYPVPAGSEVMLWIYLTHHDPRWWPEPEAFRPERFAPGADAGRPRLAYLPFGAGPRACVGKTFATLEAQLLLATLLGSLSFELAPAAGLRGRLPGRGAARITATPRITLTPSRPIQVLPRARRAGSA